MRGKQVFGLRTIEDARSITQAAEKTNIAVVIGAGLIGMDAAYALASRGIKVNAYQQTCVADIYAAGDVCESMETFTGQVSLTPIWPSAVLQGRVAASNMVGIARQLETN